MEEKVEKTKAKRDISAIRIDIATQKLLSSLILKANRKNFGRKIKAVQLVQLALTKISEQDIKQLQDASLSNSDRLEMRFREHVKKFGAISKDEFLGLLLPQESSISNATSATSSEGKSGV